MVSSYFLARGDVTLDGVPFAFASLLERRTGGADGGVHALMRSQGADAADMSRTALQAIGVGASSR